MTNYSRGADFEREVGHALRKKGYLAWRCGGSKGEGCVDVIAARGIDWLLIQCKTDGKISGEERHAIIEAADRTFAMPLLAFKASGKIKFVFLCWGHRAREWTPDEGLAGEAMVKVFRYPAMSVANVSDGFVDTYEVSCEISCSRKKQDGEVRT